MGTGNTRLSSLREWKERRWALQSIRLSVAKQFLGHCSMMRRNSSKIQLLHWAEQKELEFRRNWVGEICRSNGEEGDTQRNIIQNVHRFWLSLWLNTEPHTGETEWCQDKRNSWEQTPEDKVSWAPCNGSWWRIDDSWRIDAVPFARPFPKFRVLK